MPHRKLWRIDVAIVGTAYVRARTRTEAVYKATEHLHDTALEVSGSTDDSEVEISGLHLSHPDLPEVSLSPAFTVRGPLGPASAAE